MKREQQILLAMKELGGKGRTEIERALDNIANERARFERSERRTAQEAKKALNKIASAMDRAHYALGKLPTEIQEELGRPDFVAHRDRCERILHEKRGRSNDHMKMVAAKEARKLLLHFRFRDTATRCGRWDTLAACLFGALDQHFSRQFRKLKEERKETRDPSELPFPRT